MELDSSVTESLFFMKKKTLEVIVNLTKMSAGNLLYHLLCLCGGGERPIQIDFFYAGVLSVFWILHLIACVVFWVNGNISKITW